MDKQIKDFAMMLMQSNPDKANTPMGREFMRVLQSEDEQAGINLANNLCQANGCTPQQAVPNATSFFKNMLTGRR